MDDDASTFEGDIDRLAAAGVTRGDLFVDDDGSTFDRETDLLGAAGVTKGCNPRPTTGTAPKTSSPAVRWAHF